MKKVLFALSLMVMVGMQALLAQTTNITGKVTDAGDGMAIPGVSVFVKGTTVGTVTRPDGTYTLTVPNDATTLVFSFVGMTTQEVAIAGQTVINASLGSDAMDIDEVMVVAYGTAKKESFTGSAEVVSTDKLQKRPVSNVSKALEGQVAGVQMTSGGGQPGSSASMVIRGFGSINSSNTPLYVVDGVPYDGAMNAINPGDIESVTVLKDAAAGALYGARGANGVILITTKKGKKSDKVEVTLKASNGVSNRAIKPYDVLDTKDFIETSFQAFKNYEIYSNGTSPDLANDAALAAMANSGTGIFGSDEMYNPYNMPISQLIDPTTGKVNPNAQLKYSSDWLDEITNENAVRQEYEISLNGGTEKTRVFSSFAYLNEDGVLKETSFERYSGRVGAEFEPKAWVTYGGNVSFAQTNTDQLGFDGSSTSNVWYSAQFMPSIYPVYQRDNNGDFILDELGAKQFDYGLSRPSGAMSNFNSVATLYEDKNYYERDNMSGRFHFDLIGEGIEDAIKGLKLSANLGFDKNNTRQTIYYNPNFGNAGSVNGRLSKYSTTGFSYTFNQLATYAKDFGNHSISILAGHEMYEYRYNYLTTSKTGFPFAGLYELASGATIASSNSYENNYHIRSYLSNLSYDFKDKYYLSASYRTDGSSRFYKDAQWGDFWSVGGSWRISEEPFMSSISQIDHLKLKASYGVQGNDNIGTYFGWQSLYDLGYPNGSYNGAMVSSIENKDLKWEENANLNIGIEGEVFSKLGFTIDYFNRKTTDMLMQLPMATSLGFDSYWANVGEMSNKGFEVVLNAKLIQTDNIKWNMTVMGSALKNKIVKLDGQKTEIVTSSTRINREGEELNSFYLTRSAGVDPNTGAQLYWVWDEDENGVAGEKYISDDVTKAASSREIIGSRIPDLYGSISTDLEAYGFDLSVLTTYSIGGYVYDGLYTSLMNPMYRGQNYHSDILRAWQKPGDITDVPRVQLEDSRTLTDRSLIDASYFAIKNITLGYTLPKNLISKIDLSKVRVFCSMDNIALFSHLEGMDPQYNFSGSTDYTYTPISTTAFGIEVKF